MPGRVPRSLIVAVVFALLVAAGALAGAAVLRLRAAQAAAAAATSGNSVVSEVDATGCLDQECHVLTTTTVGGTSVDLVADAGARTGRLRIGGAKGLVISTTVTDKGVTLTGDSLQCASGSWSACLIRGRDDAGQLFAQLVVGRSGNWSSAQKIYGSSAGYLSLANVDADTAPEILAAQFDCPAGAACAGRPVYLQVYDLISQVVGCSKRYASLDKLPGYPVVQINKAALSPAQCR